MTLFPELDQELPPYRCGAMFSQCGTFRYKLSREWGDGGRTLTFLMLNPSTADAERNDPTIAGCEKRARDWGYDRLVVINLFAYRSTDPRAVKIALMDGRDVVGHCNDEMIATEAQAAETLVCAWGNHGTLRDRNFEVIRMLRQRGVTLHALRVTKADQPEHPLYLPHSLRPTLWTPALPDCYSVAQQ